jgi:outer membrane protein TolC
MRRRWSRGGPLLLALAGTLAGCQSVSTADPAPPEGRPSLSCPAAPAIPPNLAGCLNAAVERQPRVAAARASLAAAEDGRRALEDLRFPASLAREVPIRRKQAALGVSAAAAGLEQAERETTYAVTRTWLTVLYAREQERLAGSVAERLTTIQQAAQDALDAGARDVTAADVQRTAVYLRLAEAKRTQATQGVKRALAALAESVGMDPDAALDVPPGRLPEPGARPARSEVVSAALARRGELVQAGILAQVACLEVEAQGTGVHPRMPTFAAGSDVHAAPVPPAVRDKEYRPGAVPPGMPTLLVGPRPDRVKQAQDLSARAEAVLETTRRLVALEAADAFLRWEEAERQARQARQAAELGEKLADDLGKDFRAGLKVRVEEVVSARVLAAEARSQYNEYLYRQIVALADLERVTAGGFRAGLVEPPR